MAITQQTYAELSQAAYKAGGGQVNAPWTCIQSKNINGFRAAAYLNTDTQELVIAVPGTDFKRPETLINDFQLIMKKSPYFEQCLLNFTNEVLNQLPPGANPALIYTARSPVGIIEIEDTL